MRTPSSNLSRVSLAALAAAVAGVALPGAAHAGAFYLQEQSVKGLGRAYSGEVSDQGAAQLWWNPAAIARSPRELYLGAQSIWVSGDVNDRGSTITRPVPPAGLTTPVGGNPNASDPIENGVAPNFAVSTPINDQFSVGFSVAAPYNFTTKYPMNSWARYDALKTRLTTVDLQGTLAMRATEWLDLGVGVDAEYTDALLSNALPNLSPLQGDGSTVLKGNGWNWGFVAGAQAHFDTVTIGASYRSSMSHDLDGSVVIAGLQAPLNGSNVNTPGQANFKTPWIATIGLRWQATPQLAWNAQLQRFGWSEFDAIRIKYAGQSQTEVQNYKDTTAVSTGFDYAVNPAWTLRAGVQYDQTPTPSDIRTPRVPDSNRWLLTGGLSWMASPNVIIDGSLGYIAFQSTHVYDNAVFYGGTLAQTVVNYRGDVSGNAVIASLGLRWRF